MLENEKGSCSGWIGGPEMVYFITVGIIFDEIFPILQ